MSDEITRTDPTAVATNGNSMMSIKQITDRATLTVTGAADLFTQDLIDEVDKSASAKKAPYKAPEKKEATPGDTQTVEGVIESVAQTSGAKNGKTWVKYGIKIDGNYYSTFSATLAADAKACAGILCELDYTKSGKVNNAHALRIAGAADLLM